VPLLCQHIKSILYIKGNAEPPIHAEDEVTVTHRSSLAVLDNLGLIIPTTSWLPRSARDSNDPLSIWIAVRIA
jgi:hypothetical protein